MLRHDDLAFQDGDTCRWFGFARLPGATNKLRITNVTFYELPPGVPGVSEKNREYGPEYGRSTGESTGQSTGQSTGGSSSKAVCNPISSKGDTVEKYGRNEFEPLNLLAFEPRNPPPPPPPTRAKNAQAEGWRRLCSLLPSEMQTKPLRPDNESSLKAMLDEHGEQIVAATISLWVRDRIKHGHPPVDETLRAKWSFFFGEYPEYLAEVLEKNERGKLEPIFTKKEKAGNKLKAKQAAIVRYKAEFEQQVASLGPLSEKEAARIDGWRSGPHDDEDEAQYWYSACGGGHVFGGVVDSIKRERDYEQRESEVDFLNDKGFLDE